MIQKIEKAVAVALATASILSLALGAAFTLTHGPEAFMLGLTGFLLFGLSTAILNRTV
jgi:uncharacterized membrane protein AbrB (regulator of aidB expression)